MCANASVQWEVGLCACAMVDVTRRGRDKGEWTGKRGEKLGQKIEVQGGKSWCMHWYNKAVSLTGLVLKAVKVMQAAGTRFGHSTINHVFVNISDLIYGGSPLRGLNAGF